MERFLQIITIVCIFFIGSGSFSFLYALSVRIARKIRIRQKLEELEEAGSEVDKSDPETAESDTTDTTETEETDQAVIDRIEEEDVELGRDYVCESCGSVLKPWEIIPIFSFLRQKGRCSWCGAKIPTWELLSEILGGCLLELIFFRFGRYPVLASPIRLDGVLDITASFRPGKIPAILLLVIVFGLLFLVSMVDQKSMEIPNVMSLCMLAAGIGSIFVFPEISLLEHLIGLVCISVPLLLVTLLIPGAFGGGDIKLMAGAGLFLGWKLVLVAFFIGILTGGIYAIVLLAGKKIEKKGHFAFGPFLCLGIGIAILCGSSLLQAYLSMGRRLYGL